ncbi:hypothetical protein ACLB2K_050588 [Fragaria x ananassa]
MVHGGRNGVDYYGVLDSVVELVYGESMTVHIFKCKWFDTSLQSMKTDQYGILSVNTATSSYEDDQFVFATSVKQVFYLDDLAKGDAWKVVNLVHPRNIYRAATLGEAEDEEEDVAYQEPNVIDEDSGDEERHRLPEINSDTEEDSSDDSDYEP